MTQPYQNTAPSGNITADKFNGVNLLKKCKTARIPARTRRGAALTENLLVVGLVVLALVGILALYTTVQQSYRTAQLSSQMTQIIGGIQRAYANSASYGADSVDLVAVLDGGGDIPASAHRDTDPVTIEHAFGGKVTVDQANAGQNVDITIQDLPESACERFLEGFIGLGNNNASLVHITVRGRAVIGLPISRLVINTECDGSDNDVVLRY